MCKIQQIFYTLRQLYILQNTYNPKSSKTYYGSMYAGGGTERTCSLSPLLNYQEIVFISTDDLFKWTKQATLDDFWTNTMLSCNLFNAF